MPKTTRLLWKALSLLVFCFLVTPSWAFRCPKYVAYYHFLIAEEVLKEGHLEQGAKELRRVLSCDPKAVFPRKELLKVYAQLGRYQEAIDMAQEVLKRAPKDSETRFILGKLYIAQGRPARAIQTLEALLEDNPSYEEALSVLAMIYMRQKKLDQAIATIERLAKKKPEVPTLWLELARLYREKGDFEKAKEAYRKALALAPSELQWSLEYGEFLEKLGDIKAAEGLYQKALKENPGNFHLEQALFRLYLEEHRYQEALSILDDIERHLGPQPQLELRRALIFLDMDQPGKARKILQEVLEKDPNNAMARFYLGVALERLGQQEEAIRQYEKISPESKIFQLALRRLVHLSKDPEKIKKLLEKALGQNPEDKDLYALAGSLFEDLDQCELGYTFVKRGLKRFPDDPKLKLSAAFLLTCLGEDKKALKFVEPLLKEDPDNPTILNFVGYTYAELNIKLEEAERLIQKALKLRPNDGYIIDSLAWVYYRKGDYQKALETIKKALEQVKDDAIIYEHEGDILKAMGRNEEALKAYRKALKLAKRKRNRQRLEEKIKALCAKLPCSL